MRVPTETRRWGPGISSEKVLRCPGRQFWLLQKSYQNDTIKRYK